MMFMKKKALQYTGLNHFTTITTKMIEVPTEQLTDLQK